jgi:uncharacterized protein
MREKVFVSESTLGRGLFAKFRIEPLETVFYLTGRIINFDEAVTSEHGEHSIQVGLDRYVSTHTPDRFPHSPARFINHSCAPNAGFVDEIRLIALNRILPGEEICFDYSTTMLERYWELDCMCLAPQCRGRIRDFDLLPLSWQQHYLGLGVVPDYIIKYMASDLPVVARVA